jgi:integral membrane protein
MTVSTDSPLTPSFRLIAYLEGGSFLVLLFIAMPLKYWAGYPLAVRVIGLAHGLLFLAYAVSVLHAVTEDRFSVGTGIKAFIASLLPFGPFVFEARPKRSIASP